ncbi:MAG: hypothetical protein I8H71_02355 [Xanthomonadaceae bacterium]|nr:hypothetical protein [Xanthomonadaceae bacterium]
MSNVYALQGKGSSGKTDTITQVFTELVRKYPHAAVQQLVSDTRDIKVIVTNIQGHTIGIESQGDPNSRLQQSLQDFVNAKCDIIFSAARTTGMTVNWVNSLSPPYAVHFISQSYVTANFNTNNLMVAQSLIKQAGL